MPIHVVGLAAREELIDDHRRGWLVKQDLLYNTNNAHDNGFGRAFVFEIICSNQYPEDSWVEGLW